jgi:ribonuclease Z
VNPSEPGRDWVVLGAGTAIPHPERSPSGHLFWAEKGPVLVDMGPGTLWRMAAQGVHLRDLAGLVLTHRHLDHFLDLPALLFASRIPGHGRTAALEVHVGPGMLEHIGRFRDALGTWFEPRGFEVVWVEHDPGEGAKRVRIGGCDVELRRVQHDATSIALRVHLAAGTVTYSGDSDDCEGLRALCAGVDVAVLECSSAADAKLEGHLTPREVANIAAEAAVGRVVLVHTYPDLDGVDLEAEVARFGYNGPVAVATDGFRIGL